jgi:hypothetical protein
MHQPLRRSLPLLQGLPAFLLGTNGSRAQGHLARAAAAAAADDLSNGAASPSSESGAGLHTSASGASSAKPAGVRNLFKGASAEENVAKKVVALSSSTAPPPARGSAEADVGETSSSAAAAAKPARKSRAKQTAAAADDATPEAAPKRSRAREEKATPADPEGKAAEADPVVKRRSRAKKPSAADPAGSDVPAAQPAASDSAEVAPKPRRRKDAATTTEVASPVPPDTGKAPEPPKKARAPSRKKAAAAGAAEAASSSTAEEEPGEPRSPAGKPETSSRGAEPYGPEGECTGRPPGPTCRHGLLQMQLAAPRLPQHHHLPRPTCPSSPPCAPAHARASVADLPYVPYPLVSRHAESYLQLLGRAPPSKARGALESQFHTQLEQHAMAPIRLLGKYEGLRNYKDIVRELLTAQYLDLLDPSGPDYLYDLLRLDYGAQRVLRAWQRQGTRGGSLGKQGWLERVAFAGLATRPGWRGACAADGYLASEDVRKVASEVLLAELRGTKATARNPKGCATGRSRLQRRRLRQGWKRADRATWRCWEGRRAHAHALRAKPVVPACARSTLPLGDSHWDRRRKAALDALIAKVCDRRNRGGGSMHASRKCPLRLPLAACMASCSCQG